MKKISVDVENLESAVSYFVLAFNELEEMQYRLKLIGNEIISDVDLTAAPEYEQIMQLYQEVLNNTNQLHQILEGLVGILTNVPKLYKGVDAKNADRINELITKSFEYEVANNDLVLNEFMSDIDDKSFTQIVDVIEKNLKELTFADIMTSSNQTKADEAE